MEPLLIVSDRAWLRARRLRWMVLVLTASALLGCSRAPGDPAVEIVAPDGSDRARVRVEIVDTPSKREVGLMYRSHLDEDAGMIFVFAESAQRNFWMKNTEIPLDMIFADGAGRIGGVVINAQPYSEESVTAGGPAQYVLEVNGGFCARHRVAAGDRFKFLGFEPHARQ